MMVRKGNIVYIASRKIPPKGFRSASLQQLSLLYYQPNNQSLGSPIVD